MFEEKLVEIGYNLVAQNYHDKRNKNDGLSELNEFAKQFKKGEKILDLGCGAGVPVTKFLVEHEFEVTGVDISEAMLKLAKKNVPKAKYVKSNMLDIDFPENSFDGLTAFYSIIHVSREKQAELFKKINKILRLDGIILISMGSEEWEGKSDDFHGAKMTWSQWSPEKSIQIIKDAGFEIIFDKHIESDGETHYWIMAKCLK